MSLSSQEHKSYSRDNYRKGQKRGNKVFNDENGDQNADAKIDTSSPIIRIFLDYQKELDAKHDKYERLVKNSRDLTIESKRIIFLLHRIKSNDDKLNILNDAENRLKELQKNTLYSITMEVLHEDVYQFLKAFSPGIQEFVEAMTFCLYEKHKELVSLEDILIELERNILTTNNDENIALLKVQLRRIIQPSDYILGIADLTGELMRKCIMAIGMGQMEMPFELCYFLRQVHDGFVSIGNQGPREVTRKLFTLKQSLAKVETACYTLQVRGSEIPKHMLVDVFTSDNRNYHEEMESVNE